ncbi:MAG TPA: hypothetical protein PLV68_06845, partial [Ilumatobacteraceae bacterium]|nr:hypothetical protein [Ilumatobacteraceae bacterium]
MGTRPNYVYVASSWRNPVHADVIDALAVAGIDHYDFKNPSGGTGFSWREVMELERVSHDFVPYRANPTICSVCGSVQPMPCLSLPAALTATAGVPAKGADWVPARRYLDMVSHRRAIEAGVKLHGATVH